MFTLNALRALYSRKKNLPRSWKSLPSAISRSIVTQRSSKVEANQNTAYAHPWQKNRIVSKQKHKQAKPFGWTWAFKFRPSSCFRKQISVQEKANFLVASLEQSLPLLELCTFKIILHTIAENVSNHHLRTAAHNNRKVFLGSNPGRQGQRRFV